jgi:hypothetical protein
MKIGLEARVAIIGAGACGITAAKHLLQVGHTNFVVYDRNQEVGGNWIYDPQGGYSSMYETAHIVSSKTMTAYRDYPMPDHYPDYPNHRLIKDYLQSYARHFGVLDYIEFGTEVTQAVEQPDKTWRLTLGDRRVEQFDHLIVANGHHWDPRYPTYAGKFEGQLLHSHYFRSPEPFKNQRVLVIGGGNSACDIVCDIARQAQFTALSWRRGYYVVPKIMFGNPPDVTGAYLNWIPRPIRQKIMHLMWWLVTGGNARYGLPKPDHEILDSHPVANSQLLYWIRHGDVHPRRDVARFEGKKVHFVDGLVEEYDTVIAATGYWIRFPFFDKTFLDYSEGAVPLYLRLMPADHPSLYFIGLFQPQGAIWPLADTQAQIVANRVVGNYTPPADIAARIEQEVSATRRRYQDAARHTIEVEFDAFQKALLRELPPTAPRWTSIPQGHTRATLEAVK